MLTISSKNNEKIKDLVKLRDNSKSRNDKSLFYVEGERLFIDIPKNLIFDIYIKKSKCEYFSKVINDYSDTPIYILDDDVYDKVSDTINSQGIIARVKYNTLDNIDKSNLSKINNIIILDKIQDPGNLGTIIRVSEAAGIDLIIISDNSCSIYNTKTIRASMSSIFRKNIFISNDLKGIINILKDNNFKVFATAISDDSHIYYDKVFNDKNAVIFGNEANGVSQDLISLSDEKIKIPMYGKIQSLNVAISSSIIVYEILRQSNKNGN